MQRQFQNKFSSCISIPLYTWLLLSRLSGSTADIRGNNSGWGELRDQGLDCQPQGQVEGH